jgi:geranylgeranyl diphosphate synthase type II
LAVSRFAQHIGLAFQITDDLLDVTSTAQQMGKATNKDANRGKTTYPALLGVQASRQQANAEWRRGIEALAPFGELARGLELLARFVVQRNA